MKYLSNYGWTIHHNHLVVLLPDIEFLEIFNGDRIRSLLKLRHGDLPICYGYVTEDEYGIYFCEEMKKLTREEINGLDWQDGEVSE